MAEIEVFDTDLISQALRDDLQARRRFETTPKVRRFTTIINEMEILVPKYRYLETADTTERMLNAQKWLNIARDVMRTAFADVLPVDLLVVDLSRELSQHKGLGKIGRKDLLIAAIALRHDAVLVTGNVAHFTKVPRLKLLDFRE